MIARYQAIERILSHMRDGDLVVSTTGMISRELFTLDDRPGNFYMIGSMGLASAMGLGLAIQAPNKRVFVLEGDGSALMSLGTLPLIASERPANLVHIILDNEAYESTGGQASISLKFDLFIRHTRPKRLDDQFSTNYDGSANCSVPVRILVCLNLNYAASIAGCPR